MVGKVLVFYGDPDLLFIRTRAGCGRRTGVNPRHRHEASSQRWHGAGAGDVNGEAEHRNTGRSLVLDVQAIVLQELSRALKPAEAFVVSDAVRLHVADLASRRCLCR
jgi:hypothetical protein